MYRVKPKWANKIKRKKENRENIEQQQKQCTSSGRPAECLATESTLATLSRHKQKSEILNKMSFSPHKPICFYFFVYVHTYVWLNVCTILFLFLLLFNCKKVLAIITSVKDVSDRIQAINRISYSNCLSVLARWQFLYAHSGRMSDTYSQLHIHTYWIKYIESVPQLCFSYILFIQWHLQI